MGDDFLPNDFLETIGYKAGGLLLKTEGEKGPGEENEEERAEYTDLHRFLVEVAGFSRSRLSDLIYNDAETKKYIRYRRAIERGSKIAKELTGGETARPVEAGDIEVKVADIKPPSLKKGVREFLFNKFGLDMGPPQKTVGATAVADLVDEATRKAVKNIVTERELAGQGDALDMWGQRQQAENFKLTMVLQPRVVSAISMAFEKLKDHRCLPRDAQTLDELMLHEDYGTHFAYLTAVQMQMANYEHPGRYLTKNHLNTALRQERAIIMRFKRKTGAKRPRVEDRVFAGIDSMQNLGSYAYYDAGPDRARRR